MSRCLASSLDGGGAATAARAIRAQAMNNYSLAGERLGKGIEIRELLCSMLLGHTNDISCLTFLESQSSDEGGRENKHKEIYC